MRTLTILAMTAALLASAPGALAQENKSEPKATDGQAARQTEVLLRKHIEGMRVGKPIYEHMTPEVAEAVKPLEEAGKARLAQLGAIRSLEFRGITPTGVDTYFVQYEKGASDYWIALNDEGKIGALVVRPGQ
jgi:hypothetical protein